MPRFTSTQRATLQSVASNDVQLMLLEITHPSLGAPVRLVDDNTNVTSHGNVYVAIGFAATLPDDADGGAPAVQLVLDNVGRELMQWIEASNGGVGANVRIMVVRRAEPDTLEYDITVSVQRVDADMQRVTITLGYDNLLDRPAIELRHDPRVTPGIY